MCQSSDITSYFLYYEVLIRSKDAADVVDDASCGPWVPEQNLQLNRLIHGIFETFGVLIERLLDLRIFYSQIMGVLTYWLLLSLKTEKFTGPIVASFFFVGFVVHDWKWFSPWSVENKLYQHWKLSGCQVVTQDGEYNWCWYVYYCILHKYLTWQPCDSGGPKVLQHQSYLSSSARLASWLVSAPWHVDFETKFSPKINHFT